MTAPPTHGAIFTERDLDRRLQQQAVYQHANTAVGFGIASASNVFAALVMDSTFVLGSACALGIVAILNGLLWYIKRP
jgi:tryptophan synthase alpha subunit